jgi:hypothetical protein
VYLGSLASPPTIDQLRLLKLWDVLVVDPLQDGVVGGLVGNTPTSSHVLARFEVPALVKVDASLKKDDVIKNLGIVLETVNTRLVLTANELISPFTGILLADFSKYFQPTVLNELARHIHSLGLDLWLELSHPDYLREDEAHAIDMKLVQGIVYRNAMIRTDGDRQNYFHMTAMRTVMRAVAYQTVGQSHLLAMWETVDDDKELQYAVVARSHKLCTFYNSMCWIGHANALMDAEAATTRTLAARPLGALMWLKDDANMEAHSLWRGNDEVCHQNFSDKMNTLDCKLTLVSPGLRNRRWQRCAIRELGVHHSRTFLKAATTPSGRHTKGRSSRESSYNYRLKQHRVNGPRILCR